MMREYITIREPAETEIVIKKSRFIGRLLRAETPEEGIAALEAVKKRHWDATHNCSAMIIGENREFMRCSDDGEPQGTAGVPMLEALKMSGLTNVLAVVTRYFGGTLLGAGGLVRAYSASVAETLKAAEKIRRTPYAVYAMEVPFKLWGKIESQVLGAGCLPKGMEYLSCVAAEFYVGMGKEERFCDLIRELSSGTVVPRKTGEEYVESPTE